MWLMNAPQMVAPLNKEHPGVWGSKTKGEHPALHGPEMGKVRLEWGEGAVQPLGEAAGGRAFSAGLS